jgi:DNA-binding MarR family transcriptional regulator
MHRNSITTYRQLKADKQLSPKRLKVYTAIKELTKCTNKEIATYLGIPINEITGRVSELAQLGKIRECGTAICAISGKPNALWEIC